MNVWTFLRDKLFSIIVYFLNVGLIVLVIELDLLQSDLFLQKASVIYIFVLSLAVMVVYLTIDYLRQWPFYREFNDVKKSANLDRVSGLGSAVTKEQKEIQDLVHENYREYMNELVAYQERQERHHHFMNQWVHSMKTPVSVMNLLIQQSDEIQSLEEARNLFKSMGEENERLAHGLDMILHTSRLEKFEVDVSLKRVELVGLVRKAINENKKAMIRHAVFPRLICDKEAVYVETDEKWLAFILSQLTTNAIKYTPKGENRGIVYEITEVDGICTLKVKDEGIGIPRQDLSRVFDPFFTGENGRQGSESTGMGLYLAKEVCNRLGHQISLESEEGAGTTVTLTFSNESIIRDTFP